MAKILLVDDSATDRHLFSELLKQDDEFQVVDCADGDVALSLVVEERPDLVLTDMQMPNMDGLQLVQQLRRSHPELPVILITGQGSEDLATKALRAGAAGYIAKSRGQEELVKTLRHVLWMNEADETDQRIRDATTMVHHELSLANDESLIPGLLSLTRRLLLEYCRCDPVMLLQCETALEEAVLNAIYHGNLDFKQLAGLDFDVSSRVKQARIMTAEPPYSDRRVTVSIHLTRDECRFVVRDEGAGFDIKEVSSLGLTQSLRGEAGRGLFLMWAFMDKVVFDKTGNSVTMFKKLSKTAPTSGQNRIDEPAQTAGPILATLHAMDGTAPLHLRRRRATVGTDPGCQVVIPDAEISEHHCVLFVHEGWWFVRDLESKHGIRINGQKFKQHLLQPDAALTLGTREYRITYEPQELGASGANPPADPT
ncbi:MAG: response regulator, partial [Planctomycetota bacterium]